MNAKQTQDLAVLNGERGNPGEHAVRMRILTALASGAPVDMSAKVIAAAPTAADYNALVNDIHALYAAINAMRVQMP